MAANVFTFIPPPVDCDAPPIHIRKRTMRRVTFMKRAGLSDTNPALRGVAELNTDWVTLSAMSIPCMVLLYSRQKNAAAPATSRIM